MTKLPIIQRVTVIMLNQDLSCFGNTIVPDHLTSEKKLADQ